MLVKEVQHLKEGYIMRPVRMEDVDRVTALINKFSQATAGLNEVDRAEIKNFWGTPGLSMDDDLRLVESPDGNVTGYVEALTLSETPVHPFIWFRIDPDHADPDVGAALMNWAIERGSRVLEVLPADLRVSLHTFIISGYEPARQLFEKLGFTLIRHGLTMEIEMNDEPAAATWPAGIALQPFDESLAADVYRAHDEAFSDHFGHVDEPFEAGFARFKHMHMEDKQAYDPTLWFVAMDGDQVAGYSICRINRQDEDKSEGWVNILGVRRNWRKRGLGMALLQHSFSEFYKRGLRVAGLSVDASNLTGALELYKRAGMHIKHQYDRYEKELRPGKELMTTEVS